MKAIGLASLSLGLLCVICLFLQVKQEMNSQSPNEGSSSQRPFQHVGDVPEQISGDVGSPDDLDFDVGQFLVDDPTTQFGKNIVSPQEEVQPQTFLPENIRQEDLRQDSSVSLFELGTNNSLSVENNIWPRQILPERTSVGNLGSSSISAGNIHPQQNLVTPSETSPYIRSQEQYIWPGQMLSGGTAARNLGNSTMIPESMANPFESVPNISFPVQNNFSGQILSNQTSSRRTVRTSNINLGNIHPHQNLANRFESSPNISSSVPSIFPGQILPGEASRGNGGTSTINPESMANPFESVPNISFPVQNNFSRQILPNQASSRRNVRISNIDPAGKIHPQQNLATPFETSPNISSSVLSILPGKILPGEASRGNVGTSIINPESMANPFVSVPSISFPVQNKFPGQILPNQTSSRRTARTSNINPGNIHQQQNLANRFESSPNVSSSVQSILPGQILPSEASRGNEGTSIINPGSIHPQRDLTDHPLRYQQNTYQAGQNSNTLEGSAPTSVQITGGQSRNKRSLPSTAINPHCALETLEVPIPSVLTWTRRKKAARGRKRQTVLGRNGQNGPGLSRFSKIKKNPGEISGTSSKEKGIADHHQRSSQEDHNFHANPNLSGTIDQQQKSSQDDQNFRTNHNLQKVVQEACDREYQRLLKEISDAAANTSSQTQGTNLSGDGVNSSDAAIEMPLPLLSLDDLDGLEDETNNNAPVPDQEMDDDFWNFLPEDIPSFLLHSLGFSVEDQSNDAPTVEDQTDNAAASSVKDQPNNDPGGSSLG